MHDNVHIHTFVKCYFILHILYIAGTALSQTQDIGICMHDIDVTVHMTAYNYYCIIYIRWETDTAG